MASGKPFIAVLGAVIFFEEFCCFLAFPVQDYAEISDTKPQVKFFECHAMACLIGYQFCHPFWKRCDDCSFYEKDCFTSRQQLNCTVFCQETWLMKQREILKNKKNKTGEGQNSALPWIVATAVLAVLLLACGCVLFLIKIRSSVRWICLELPNQSGKCEAAENLENIHKTETETFLVQDDSSKQEQQTTCTNKPSNEGTKKQQSSDAYRSLDPKSIYFGRSNIKNTPLPSPETDSED